MNRRALVRPAKTLEILVSGGLVQIGLKKKKKKKKKDFELGIVVVQIQGHTTIMGIKVKKGNGGILDILADGSGLAHFCAWRLKPLGSRFHALVLLVSSKFQLCLADCFYSLSSIHER